MTLITCDGVTLKMRGGDLLSDSCCATCCGSSSSGSGYGGGILSVWTLSDPAAALGPPLDPWYAVEYTTRDGSAAGVGRVRRVSDEDDNVPEMPAP